MVRRVGFDPKLARQGHLGECLCCHQTVGVHVLLRFVCGQGQTEEQLRPLFSQSSSLTPWARCTSGRAATS